MNRLFIKITKPPTIKSPYKNSINILRLFQIIFQMLQYILQKFLKIMAGKHAMMPLYNGFQDKRRKLIKSYYSMVLVNRVKLEFINQDLILDMLVKMVLISEQVYTLLIMQHFLLVMLNLIRMVIAICSYVGQLQVNKK